jgi:Tfp pilus assembly protein PilN
MNAGPKGGKKMHRITNTSPTTISPQNDGASREERRPERASGPAWTHTAQNETLRRRVPQGEEANSAMPPQQPIGAMPQELLNKLHSHIISPRDKAHFALASADVLSATSPASNDTKLAHLQELARCANDIKSFMLVLDSERQLPAASRARLLTELAGKVIDIAQWATSSHQHMQAATPLADRGFRQLSDRVAELPPALQAEPLFVLGRQLGARAIEARLGAMDGILTATQDASSNPQRFELLKHLALRLNQFPSRDVQGAVQRLLDETTHLSAAQQASLCNALRSGLGGTKILLDQHAAVTAAIDQVSPRADPAARPRGRESLQFRRPTR